MMRVNVESLLKEFCGWQDLGFSGGFYLKNMENGLEFGRGFQNGQKREFGTKCCTIFRKIQTWNV